MTDQLSPDEVEEIEHDERAQVLIERATRFAQAHQLVAELAPRSAYNGGPVISVELTDLFAAAPGQGDGTRFMRQLIGDANALGITLIVHPGTPRNTEFYARFGFEHGGGFGFMQRLPPLPEEFAWLREDECASAPTP